MYVARELKRKEVGKCGKPCIPSALRGAGNQKVNFRNWVGALWLVRLPRAQTSEAPLGRSERRGAPAPSPEFLTNFLTCFSTLNPLDSIGSFPKHLDSYISPIYEGIYSKSHLISWINLKKHLNNFNNKNPQELKQISSRLISFLSRTQFCWIESWLVRGWTNPTLCDLTYLVGINPWRNPQERWTSALSPLFSSYVLSLKSLAWNLWVRKLTKFILDP